MSARSEKNASTLPWALWALAMALALGSLVFLVISWSTPAPEGAFGFRGFAAGFAVAFGTVGALVASRLPANPIGWLMLGAGLLAGFQGLANEYAIWAVLGHEPPLALGEVAAWVPAWIWIPATSGAMFVLFLFPDGHLLSPRWRGALGLGVIGTMTAAASYALGPGPLENFRVLGNPFGIGSRDVFLVAGMTGLALYGAGFALAGVSVVIRFRRSTGDERQQMRWLVAAGGFLVISLVASFVSQIVNPDPGAGISFAMSIIVIAGFSSLPIALGFGILKYRLYDIDVVIKKTVVFAIVVVVLTGLYLVVIALAAGGVIGGLLIALTFRPVRAGARRVADRLVYGKRATPYEVLTEFSGRIGATYAADDVLPRMAALLREATGASIASVWLGEGAGAQAVASSPSDAAASDTLPDDAATVSYQGETLGALSVEMPTNDPLDPTRRKLVQDLAAQAGPVLSNVRLIADLKASRRRIVSAQDERAKKLERDIHDGAQQQLVALAVKLKLADQLVERDPAQTHSLLGSLQTETNEALQNLRDLARGIYPPLLADKGLGAALEAQARKSPVPVTVDAGGVGRLPPEVEAAAYFSVLEALNNVAKYAHASSATVHLTNGIGQLRFEVTDDGSGFDTSVTTYGTGLQGIADRLAALGGSVAISSEPEVGTTVTGTIPIDAERGR